MSLKAIIMMAVMLFHSIFVAWTSSTIKAGLIILQKFVFGNCNLKDNFDWRLYERKIQWTGLDSFDTIIRKLPVWRCDIRFWDIMDCFHVVTNEVLHDFLLHFIHNSVFKMDRLLEWMIEMDWDVLQS